MRTGIVGSVGLAAVVAFGAVGTVQAEPDMRDIPPFVMIVADTSGSMEWKPGCSCTTECTTCYPDCSASNDSTGKPPPEKKNRWAMLVESLTGTFKDFQCVPLPRTDSSQFTYDLGYSKPFHRPWVCPNGATYCPYPGTATSPIQVQNGLLDNYGSRIRFGLATFDGVRTYAGTSDLVTSFNTTLSTGPEGMYSYGGEKPVRYPTCSQTHLIDSGIRGPGAPEGGLITLDYSDGGKLCATPPCDPQLVNAAIQDTLLKTRTFGGTPTGSALDDLYHHFKTEVKVRDTMATCRQRFAILITDGVADDDFREYPVPGCDCNSPTRNNCPTNEDPKLNVCPYPTAAQAAADLVSGRVYQAGTPDETKDEKQIEKLYVVGMSIADAESRKSLDLIASGGGTDKAFYADDPSTLTATLDELLGRMTNPISRSVPAFATGILGGQYQVSSGFDISPATAPPGFAPPWFGILERRRFVCSTNGDLTSPDLADDDKFHVQLNKQDADDRRLWTALPSSPTPTNITKKLTLDPTITDGCGSTGCIYTPLDKVKPTNLFGSIDDTRKGVVLDWMYGRQGSLREKYKLGDIYHSSPAIVGPPKDDPGDQSYTLFRGSTLIDQRPTTLYVNSNDGILHAFVLEDHKVGTDTKKAGYELWGFVPPILIGSLNSQLSAHSLNLDGTPVVKDVYFSKGSAPSATDYKTVLITGMRAGGKAYVALDVTDPVNPKFLWQFTDDDMGYTYGLPEIVQARYSVTTSQPATLRAMAILSGGKGALDDNGPGCDKSAHVTPAMELSANRTFPTYSAPDLGKAAFTHRTAVRCWGRQGRSLYFVDIETGKLIKKIVDGSTGMVFPSPIVGSPTAYQDAVGTVATEGFVIDADGVVWRIDLTSDVVPDEPLKGWTVRPFHDLFWDVGPLDGETTYERPILSLDDKHQLVVIVGTGDTDNFEKATAMNRVVSLTEMVKVTAPSAPTDYVAGLNWELRADTGDTNGKKNFVPSELVTGTMALFSQQLFFASFISRRDDSNPCATGLGRMWSVHYTESDPNYRNNTYATKDGSFATFGPRRIPVVATNATSAEMAQNTDTSKFNIDKSLAEDNLLVLGLGSTQRPTCGDPSPLDVNNYYSPAGMLDAIKQTKTPSIWIVAQASDANSKDDKSARKHAGSALGSIEVKLDRPLEFSQVSSWAGSIE